MTARSKKHGPMYRLFFDSIPIEGGGYKLKLNLIKIIIIVAVVVGSLVILQLTGALPIIGKIVGAIFR